MLLTNRFCWFGAGALGVERQRTGLKLGSGSEPALELPWWKRGINHLHLQLQLQQQGSCHLGGVFGGGYVGKQFLKGGHHLLLQNVTVHEPQLPSTSSSHAAPDHDATTTMLDWRQDTILLVLLTRVSPHMLDTIWVKQVYLMPSSHCTILARFFTRRQVLINRRQMPEIGGKSVLVPASDNRAVWIIKDATWGNSRHVADARRIFGMLNIWSCRRFSILLCEWVLTGSDWKIHPRWPTANERARYRAAGSSRRIFFIEFFYKASIRIYRTGRLHEDEEEARVFPVNNILL